MIDITNKPYQCRSTDYWADDALGDYQHRYRPSDNNKNVDIKFKKTL